VSDLEPKLVTAIAFVFGVGLGVALPAWMRGASAISGRLCRRCGASLSPVAVAPFLSWLATLPRCRACGAPAPWLPAAVETAVLLLGLIGIVALPLPWAFFVPAAAFVAFVLAIRRWG
jgi:prepilin signal peptidase PulO-like enzyme (type II secretory pathway)